MKKTGGGIPFQVMAAGIFNFRVISLRSRNFITKLVHNISIIVESLSRLEHKNNNKLKSSIFAVCAIKLPPKIPAASFSKISRRRPPQATSGGRYKNYDGPMRAANVNTVKFQEQDGLCGYISKAVPPDSEVLNCVKWRKSMGTCRLRG